MIDDEKTLTPDADDNAEDLDEGGDPLPPTAPPVPA